MNLFYKIHLQAFNVISIVLYQSGPTFGQVLHSCQDAFVVAASDYSGHLIRHLLNGFEAFPTEWFLQIWEQVKGWWAHVRTVRPVGKHLPSLLTYLLTPWCRVVLEKLNGLQLVKKFPAFHGTRRFITALTSVRHLSLILGQPNPVHIPTSHLLEIHPNIIHSSTPRFQNKNPACECLIEFFTGRGC